MQLASPSRAILRGKTGIFVPPSVQKLVRTVREIAPRQCGDRVDYLTKFVLRFLDFLQRFLKGCFAFEQPFLRLTLRGYISLLGKVNQGFNPLGIGGSSFMRHGP